jgi:hypothetical protein
MAERNTEFEMANYDGGFPTHPDPEPSGRLVLTTAGKWELHYGGKGAMKRNLRTEGMAAEDCPLLGQPGSNQNRFRAAGIGSLDWLRRPDIKASLNEAGTSGRPCSG